MDTKKEEAGVDVKEEEDDHEEAQDDDDEGDESDEDDFSPGGIHLSLVNNEVKQVGEGYVPHDQAAPSIEISKALFKKGLPRDRHGELLPVIGTDVQTLSNPHPLNARMRT